MSEMILMKALSDLCVVCAVIGAFPKLFIRDFLLLWPALLCAASAGLGAYLDGKGKGKLVTLLNVIPLSALLFASDMLELLILVPFVGYGILALTRRSFSIDYYTFREQFIHTGMMLLVFGGVIFALGFFEGMFGESWTTYDFSAILFYGLIFAFTGVFAMRQLRLGADCQPKDRLRNHIQMILVLIVILLVTVVIVAAEEMMHDLIAWTASTIMAVVGFVPMVILEFLKWFMDDGGREYQDALEQVKPSTSEPTDYSYPTYEGTGQQPIPQDGSSMLMVVLLLGVLCVVLIIMLRSMNKAVNSDGSSEALEQIDTKSAHRKGPRRSNRYQIRKIYRNYLKMVRRKGQKLRIDQTSQDILEDHPDNIDVTAARTMRRLYVKARYDETSDVTDQDLVHMKEAYARVLKRNK